MRVLRLALLVIPLLALWARRADAFSASPNPLDLQNVLLGASKSGTVTISGASGKYDLKLGASGCGDWTLNTPSIHITSSADTAMVTFMPTVSGLSQCTVYGYDMGTSNERFTFQVQGTGQKPPKISVSQPSNFGSVRYNNASPSSSSTRMVTVTNNGDQDLVISSISLGGTNQGAFTFTGGTSNITITAGNQHQWTVTFNPQSPAGTKSAMLTFASNDPNNGTVSVSLDGTATTASITSSPLTVDFMLVNDGSSRAKDITVDNAAVTFGGPLGVTVGTIDTGLDTQQWFSFTGCAATAKVCTFAPPYAIANGTNALIGVKCTPPPSPDTLIHTATVTFTSDSDVAGGNTVMLKCQAGTSKIVAMPNTVNFGSQLVTAGGGAAVTMQITVTNSGTSDATLASFPKASGQPAQFDVTACSLNPCKVTANGGMVTLDVTYTPGSEGDVYTSLDMVLSPSGNGPSVSLVGHGVDKHLGEVIDAIDFPDTYRNPGDKTPMQDLVITNTGEYPLTINDVTVAGDASIWSLATPPAGMMIPKLSSTTLQVLFTPTDVGKAPNAVLHVKTNDVNKPDATVTLSGNGKLRNVDVAPGSIDIGDTFAGIPAQLSITHAGSFLTIVNKDDVAFNMHDLVVEGDDADAFHVIDTTGADFVAADIAPGATQQFDVIFNPKYPGDYSATVSLYLDQDPVAQKPVPIHGHAVYVEAYGGGGCSTGGDTGALSVLLVGGVAGFLRRRRR